MNRQNLQLEELLSDDSFIRWIEGTASSEEKQEWTHWAKKDPAREKLVRHAKKVHQSFHFTRKNAPIHETESELKKLNRAIDLWIQPKKAHKLPAKKFAFKRTGYSSYIVAAACVLLVLSALSVFYFTHGDRSDFAGYEPSLTVTKSDFGEKKVLTLAGGSVITLQANSSLEYPESSSQGTLDFVLTGEAFFDLTPSDRPETSTYRVHTDDGLVEVIGTKFNVNTFREGTEVVLEQGRVRVKISHPSDETNIEHFMNPGEWTRFSNGGESIEIRNVETELYTSWTQNRLIFDRTRLADIAQRIEHIYGVQFPVHDTSLGEIEISGSVPNDNLPVLLNALESILDRPVSTVNGIIELE